MFLEAPVVSGNIVTALLALLTQLLTGFLTLITSVFNGVVAIFYVDGDFTIYGVFLLIGLILTMIFIAIRFIRGLIANRG
mgnify:CR=1 FL=1